MSDARGAQQLIAPDVKLGRDVRIFGFVNLYGCEIGDETRIGTFVEIQRDVRIGRQHVVRGVDIDPADAGAIDGDTIV